MNKLHTVQVLDVCQAFGFKSSVISTLVPISFFIIEVLWRGAVRTRPFQKSQCFHFLWHTKDDWHWDKATLDICEKHRHVLPYCCDKECFLFFFFLRKKNNILWFLHFCVFLYLSQFTQTFFAGKSSSSSNRFMILAFIPSIYKWYFCVPFSTFLYKGTILYQFINKQSLWWKKMMCCTVMFLLCHSGKHRKYWTTT